MKYAILAFTSLLFAGCSFVQASDPQMGYREFSLYRETDGSFPAELNSDIPNSFHCLEDRSSLVEVNAKGEDIWLDYSLVDGEENKKLIISSEYDILLDQSSATEGDKVEELSVKFFCVSPEFTLNGELEKEFSNYSDSKRAVIEEALYKSIELDVTKDNSDPLNLFNDKDPLTVEGGTKSDPLNIINK